MSKGKSKKASYAAEPPVQKKPVLPSRWPSESGSHARITWRVGDAELDGPWSWGRITAIQVPEVHTLLAELEKLTWAGACQGRKPKIKLVKVKDAPVATRKRLEEAKRDDIDDLVQIHVSGLERIWGVRRGNACHLLWWDPDHQVWPSPKKHT